MRRSMMHYSALLCALLLLTSVGGTFAAWRYFYPPAPVEDMLDTSLSMFDYPPEEILPGGGNEDIEVELGGDHYVLIDLVLNENEKGYGLNINNNVLLHKYLRDDGIVYSNQKVSGGNLKFILDPNNNTHGLYYCLEKVTDTQYYAYTFMEADLESVGGTSTEILAYRTILEKTDIWRATTSYTGYAKTKSLSTLGVDADPKTVPYSIDVTTWHT